MEIHYRRGKLAEFDGDAIVVATTSAGKLHEETGAAIRQAAGPALEDEAMEIAPIAVGAAIVTGGGKLRVPHVIQVPVVEAAGQIVSVEAVRRATRAALVAANRRALDRIAFAALAREHTGMDGETIARAMADEMRAFRQPRPLSIDIVEDDAMMLAYFDRALTEMR